MIDLFLYATTLQAMTDINTNISLMEKQMRYESIITKEHPGVPYGKFCVDGVEYLRFEDSGQVIIIPHFKTDNTVVRCNS